MGIIKILLVIVLLVGATYGGFVYGQMSINKNSVEIEIPVKQDVTLSLDQEINFPLKTTITFPFNKTIYIKKTLPITTSVIIDTIIKVPMNVSGIIVYVDVPIKKEVPITASLDINEPISISENIIIPINQDFKIPMKKDILIPIDTIIKTKVPLPWAMQ